jgi:hypothetical protein
VRNTAVLAGILSVLLLAAFSWWFNPSWQVLLAYGVLALIATLSVPLLYRQAGFTLKDEILWLEEREAAEHEQLTQRLETLRGELKTLGIREGVDQAERLTAILNDYHSVVETRFIGKKQSPIAYLSTARRVQKHAIQNLTDMVAVGHSLSSISSQGVGSDREQNPSRSDSRWEKFDRLNQEQSGRLEALLLENQNLFEALTDTAVEVANISSFSDYERLDTLARLVSLSEIASRTGK